jgi:type IV pilus assembly protein PilY1
MNTRTIHKIALSFILGGTLSVTSNLVMAVPPVPGISISQIPLSTGASGVTPNIMLMIDDSGSMSTTFTSTTPAISINDALPSGYTYNCTAPRTGGATTAALVTVNTIMRITNATTKRFCSSNTSCGNSSPTFSPSNCFANNQYYKISNYTNSGTTGTLFGTFLGLNLNRYFTDGTFAAGSLTAVAVTTNQSRMEVAQAAATGLVTSLKPAAGENPTVRLGLTTYNYDSNGNADGAKLLVAMGDLKSDGVLETAINTAINNLSPTGNTPLATTLSDIGRYFCTGYTGNLTLHPGVTNATDTIANIFNNHSITNNTGVTTAPIQSYCQKSAVILVSDGLPNGDRAVSSLLRDYTYDCITKGQCDSTPNNLSLPGATGVALSGSGTACKKEVKQNGVVITPADWYNKACQNGTKAGRKYEKDGSDYVDDVAVALYDMDLRPTWTGITKPAGSKNNLKTYAIGIADPELQADSVLKDAAVNGGGSFEYADNAAKLVAALDKMVADIKKGVGSFSQLTANSTKLTADTAIFQAKYDTTDWTGDLLAYPIDANANILNAVWNAGKHIPAFLSRNIYTYNSTAAAKGVKFQSQTAVQICANLTATQKTALGIISCATTDAGIWLLDYVRGDISHEQVNTVNQDAYNSTANPGPDPRAVNTSQIFRNRARFYGADAIAPNKEGDLLKPDPWLLGDIVNSGVLFVGAEDFEYTKLPSTEGSTYKTFVDNKSTRRKMAYIGANDGMLHGFDARIPATGTIADSDPEAGKEILAYIPNTIFNRLSNLSLPDYGHFYYVDGSPRAHDVYFGSAWHTVLVGTTGAGGKGIFALDVTNPDTFGVSNVLWEVSNTDAPGGAAASDLTTDNAAAVNNKGRGFAKNLGYTLPQAEIGRMHNGKWATIVANGYQSDNNLGVLYILDIETGAIIAAIDTKASSAGLSTPFLVDVNDDGIIDSVYAGDLIGDMWKFDVTDTDPTIGKSLMVQRPPPRLYLSLAPMQPPRLPVTQPDSQLPTNHK